MLPKAQKYSGGKQVQPFKRLEWDFQEETSLLRSQQRARAMNINVRLAMEALDNANEQMKMAFEELNNVQSNTDYRSILRRRRKITDLINTAKQFRYILKQALNDERLALLEVNALSRAQALPRQHVPQGGGQRQTWKTRGGAWPPMRRPAGPR